MEVEPASSPAPVEAPAVPEPRAASPAPAVVPDAAPAQEEPVVTPAEPAAAPLVDPMSRSPSPVRAPAEPEAAALPPRSPSPAPIIAAASRSPTPPPAVPIPAEPASPVVDAAAPPSPPPVPAPAPAFNPADFGGFDAGMMDEDAALAAALAASAADFGGGGGGGDFGGGDFGGGGGGGFGGDFGALYLRLCARETRLTVSCRPPFPLPGFDDPAQLESQLLACRCLANLMEALPGSTHTLVYHGAVGVLCSKVRLASLVSLSYIADVLLPVIAAYHLVYRPGRADSQHTREDERGAPERDCPRGYVLATSISCTSSSFPFHLGGLQALLGFLDFFGSSSQRTALRAAGNCLRNAGSDQFDMVKGVWDTIRGVLG